MSTVSVAVPRKGRPLEAVLDRVAAATGREELADEITSTLRYEKAVAKGDTDPDETVYRRLDSYSTLDDPMAPEFSLLRDDRPGFPRRIVFDSVTVPLDGVDLRLVGREEPFRALRKHEFPFGFDSADLVLEEVVELAPDPLTDLEAVNERINPLDTDVRLVAGLGDRVWHTLLATPDVEGAYDPALTRSFVADYEGPLCISPRYERLVEAILGTDALDGIDFRYPEGTADEEEAAIADHGLGVYLTVTGSTAREHGLLVGEQLFPSETVLLENRSELDETAKRVRDALVHTDEATSLAMQ